MSKPAQRLNLRKCGVRLRRTVAFLCALLVSVGGFFGCQQEKLPLQSSIVMTPDGSASVDDGKEDTSSSSGDEETEEWTGYTAEEKNKAIEALRSMINGIKAEVLGSADAHSQALLDGLKGGVSACEGRKISSKNLSAIVDIICSREALITQLVLQGVENTGGTGEELLAKEGAALFGELSALLGAEPASRLLYDFTLLFCAYKQARSLELYNASSLNVYLIERKAWKNRKEGLEKIGEDNFDCLARGVFLVAAAYDKGGEILGGFSAGDLALVLRAQGDLLSRLQMTTENWSFLFTELGDFGLPFAAISAVGETEKYAERASSLAAAIASSLAKINAGEVGALVNGEPMGYLYCVTAKWGEDEWSALEAFLSAGDERSYADYFEKEGLTERYAQFKENVERATLADLRAADESAFGEAFKNYVASVNGGLAFTVFGI